MAQEALHLPLRGPCLPLRELFERPEPELGLERLHFLNRIRHRVKK